MATTKYTDILLFYRHYKLNMRFFHLKKTGKKNWCSKGISIFKHSGASVLNFFVSLLLIY